MNTDEQESDTFDRAVAAMAEDPQVQAECTAIARDFGATEMDGLGNDQARPSLRVSGLE